MNKQKLFQSIFFILGLLSLAGLIFVIFYKPKTVYDVVILGDSNIGNVRDESSVPAIVARETALRVFNAGFGGSTMSDVNEASFVNLSEAIVNHEFSKTLALTAARDDGDLIYYDQAMRDLSKVDFNKVKVLVIAYGTNDQLSGIAMEKFAEDMSRGINIIQEKYPNIKILLVTPFYNDAESNISVEKYRDEIISIGNKDNINSRDGVNYADSLNIYDAYSVIVNKDNIDTITEDGIHLNYAGRLIYGQELAKIINELLEK